MINLFIIRSLESFYVIGLQIIEYNLVVGIGSQLTDGLMGFEDVSGIGCAADDLVARKYRLVVVAVENADEVAATEEHTPGEDGVGGG